MHIAFVTLNFKQVMENLKEGDHKRKSTKLAYIIANAEVLDIRFVVIYVHCIYYKIYDSIELFCLTNRPFVFLHWLRFKT